MKGKSPDPDQRNLLFQDLRDLLNPRYPLYRLAEKIQWGELDKHFSHCYDHTGRPAKLVRLMVSLLILKQLYNLSDESVVERWVENPYFQFFSGEATFQFTLRTLFTSGKE